MNVEKIDAIISDLTERLKAQRKKGQMWRGELSSSAISTSVAAFALHKIDAERYRQRIDQAVEWLLSTMAEDGSWGDSPESPSNMTATLLSYTSLYAQGRAPEQTKRYLERRFGGIDDEHIVRGVLEYYGKDLTFSVPILVMCALAGILKKWDRIPQFPFELTILPQRFFRFLQLPVVSYAIPALIAVGIVRFRRGKQGIFSPVREAFVPKCMRVLTSLQPENGGFLEAAPLTAFVSMCLCEADMREHTVVRKAAEFLYDTQREDGAWPIDTDLASWVTALAVKALGEDTEERELLTEKIRSNAFKQKHYFTGAQAGGWGWSDRPGAAPDGDDTSGALVALHTLSRGKYCDEVGAGVEWLMALQNNDGGMPTFCKGWGKLPFDRSSADISAHALLAMELWMDHLPEKIQRRAKRSIERMIGWMSREQAEDGSWTPLWFGDQAADDERSPVYGTATAVEYLSQSKNEAVGPLIERGAKFLTGAQNDDGGWGGARGVESKVTLTARALSALASIESADREVVERGFDYIYRAWQRGDMYRAEPIGLYFARLWYSEPMYNMTFVLMAMKKLKNLI
ncbi:MAG: prenyltransferase/squalene oxidase repeat-containing protein [Rikenellaceae bacterium]|nr:prenyltransferase/squalene oxidase repeat-containing protein [Rikenellaceae bacterium]